MASQSRRKEGVALVAAVSLLVAISLGHCRLAEGRPFAEVESPGRGFVTPDDLKNRPIIARGELAPCGRFPYIVSLQTRTSAHKCGGFLIDPYWVLTAAHCIDDDSALGPSPIVVVGACNLEDRRGMQNENGIVEVFRTERSLVHESFTGDVRLGNDIALLKLSSASAHQPVSLPESSEFVDMMLNIATIGWGSQEDGTAPVDLRLQSHVAVVPNRFCDSKDSWGRVIQDSMMCAVGVGTEQESCQGDSGGPLLQYSSHEGEITKGNPAEDIVVGITSFGGQGGCGRSELPSVYTRLSSYRDWINDKIATWSTSDDMSSTPQPQPVASQEGIPKEIFSPTETSILFRDRQKVFSGDFTTASGLVIPPQLGRLNDADLQLVDDQKVLADNPNAVHEVVIAPKGCKCSIEGISNDIDTGKGGCHRNRPDGISLCYVAQKDKCGEEGRDSQLFPGATWIACESPSAALPFGQGGRPGGDQLKLNEELLYAVPSKHDAATLSHIREIILDGADPNAQYRSTPVLHMAAQKHDPTIVELLIEAGANMHAVDEFGATALQQSAAFGTADVAELLVSWGADVMHRSNDGRRPYDDVCLFVECDGDQESRLRDMLSEKSSGR